MIGFPHAKINLGLSVISKRTDGFHELETVFYPLPFRDVLEIVPASSGSLSLSGLPVSGNPEDNLVWRACRLLREKYPQMPNASLYLHKAIPPGSGLGGGSSDAACALKMLNEFFGLGVPAKELESLALQLGSDCPFFLQSGPCYARGRGEILEPLELDLSNYSIWLIYPEQAVSTAWAFSRIQPAAARFALRELLKEPVQRWRDRLVNDFEIPVFAQYPELQKIKKQLYAAGALYASLSGSGSALYGIFPRGQQAPAGADLPSRQRFFPELCGNPAGF